jgi:hypothetical protein
MSDEATVNKYDRTYAGVREGNALLTKATTITDVEYLTGKAVTYIVQTARTEKGDYIFVQCIDESGTVRLPLPPKVSSAIAAHKDSLTKRRRSIAGKAVAKGRKERGELPAFMRKKKTA